MKTSIGLSLLLATTLFTFSCGNEGAGTSMDKVGESSAKDSSEMNIPNHPGDNDAARDTANKLPPASQLDTTPVSNTPTATFINEAASGGMMEVMLGQTAQQNAENPRVKAFGQMMVTDHTKANNELKAITDAKKFQLPAGLMNNHQRHADKLSKKKGRDFDKAYVDMMLEDHQKDIRAFERAAENGTDTTIKAFAARTLPVLRKHLDSIQAISRGL